MGTVGFAAVYDLMPALGCNCALPLAKLLMCYLLLSVSG